MLSSRPRRPLLLVTCLLVPGQLVFSFCPSSHQVLSRHEMISITSPSEGTVVHPGETLHIEVWVPSGKTVGTMTILGALGQSEEIRQSPPWSFTLKIPTEDLNGDDGPLLGTHRVYASDPSVGLDGANDPSVLLNVEMPDLPVTLRSQDSSISFEALGEEHQLVVSGVFSNGLQLNLIESCCLSFVSSDDDVATVDEEGFVRAIRPGQTLITAIYKEREKSVQLAIPVIFTRPDLDATPLSLYFGEQSVDDSGKPLEVVLTNLSGSKMTIRKPEMVGEFSETDNCVALSPLPEGGTCTIKVVFKPVLAGFSSGALQVGNTLNGGATTIFLSGVGK